MRLPCLLVASILAGAIGWSGAAWPAPPELSEFEQRTLSKVLSRRGGEIDPSPEGKLIEDIEIVTLDVIDDDDPVPEFLNLFHIKTRDRVIRRELLLGPGQRYRQRLVDESARNLRGARVLSVVLIVPVRASSADRVRLLVITRDVWSLTLSLYWEAAAPTDNPTDVQLSQLLVYPAEANLAGTHTALSLQIGLDPHTYSVGAGLAEPRLSGSRVRASASGNVVLNRESGHAEGSFGHLAYGQPLYSVDSRWGWGLFVSWREDVEREYDGLEIRTYDADVTAEPDAIPMVYDRDEWLGEYELVRSFGTAYKYDLAGGLEAKWDRYRPRAPEGVVLAAYDEYVEQEVPVSDRYFAPFVQLRAHSTEFRPLLDVDTLSLQEDYRVGPELSLRVYPAAREVGATRDMVGTFAAASYTAVVGDGLFRTAAASTAEVATDDRSDALFEGYAHLVTPRLGVGRLLYDGWIANRYRDALNHRFLLGGDGRLRGYRAGQFRGKDLVASNLEFRSASVSVLSTRLGGVLFYDVGGAFYGFERMQVQQSVGFGLRVLFPQLDRLAARLDWGFPVDGTDGIKPGFIYATFGQALPVRHIRRTGAADYSPSRFRDVAFSTPLRTRAGERL